jgi:ribosomal protein S18 acetylase RimI-like enzyme
VVVPEKRRFGYIWSVYVAPSHRRLGLARRLMECAVEHLRQEGCSQILLHSSEAGERLYEALGFERTKEMRLSLQG